MASKLAILNIVVVVCGGWGGCVHACLVYASVGVSLCVGVRVCVYESALWCVCGCVCVGINAQQQRGLRRSM